MGKINFQILKIVLAVVAAHWALAFLLVLPGVARGEERTFKDAIGREVRVSHPPKRIVSLAPDITETLFALDLDREIVGVTRFSNFPEGAKEKAKVGSYVDINIEAIIELRPDLILGTGAGNSRSQVEKLSRMGFSVFVVYPKNFNDILDTIQLIGKVVGKEKKANNVIGEMKHRIDEVYQRVAGQRKPLVFLQIGRDPIFTVSRGSFANDLISMAGGDNIAKDEKVPYPSYSLEEIILKSPEVIIISSMYTDRDQIRWLEDWRKWDILPAVKNNRLYIVNSDLIDRPSPRIIEGLEQMARMMHPEAFKE